MKVNVRQSGDVIVLLPQGTLTSDNGDGLALRNAASDAVDAGSRRLVINFQDITKAASSGLGELVSVYRTVARRGGRVKLSNASPSLRRTFEVTQVDTVFDLYATEAEAIASF